MQTVLRSVKSARNKRHRCRTDHAAGFVEIPFSICARCQFYRGFLGADPAAFSPTELRRSTWLRPSKARSWFVDWSRLMYRFE